MLSHVWLSCDPMGIFLARILEWVTISLLQGILPTQRLNRVLLHCRQTLYCLSHKGSPAIKGFSTKYLSNELMTCHELRIKVRPTLSLMNCTTRLSSFVLGVRKYPPLFMATRNWVLNVSNNKSQEYMCYNKGNYKQGEKTAFIMWENSKWSNRQIINLKNIQATPAAQFQKNKRTNQKVGQRTKQTFLQRRHTDG